MPYSARFDASPDFRVAIAQVLESFPMKGRESLARLVEGARLGDEASCRELYLAWRPGVLRLLEGFGKFDADEREDLVQEIFIRALERVGNLRSPENFERWLYSIARNQGLSALARKNWRLKAAERLSNEVEEATALIPSAAHLELDIAAVRECIDALPEGPEKETVTLFYVQGELTTQEIADRLSVGKSAVTMRLERFRARVRRRLMLQVLKQRWEP